MSQVQSGVSQRPQVFDGEGVDPTDFNALSNWSRAYLNDLVLATLMRRQYSQNGPQLFGGGAQLYSLAGSGAPRNSPTTARTIGCNQGPLFYAPPSPVIDGMTPQVRMYWLSTNEINAQLAAGDATNPRFDAVYVRITDVDGPLATRDFQDATGVITSQALITTKQTKLEWSVVAGTPAAIPTIPGGADTTWSLWGAWFVPAAMGASLFNGQQIFDYRIPMNAFTRHIIPFTAMGGTSWTISAANGFAQSTAGTGFSNALYAYLPRRSGRVMGWSFDYLASDAGSFMKMCERHPSAGSIITYPPNYSPSGIYSGASFTDADGYTLQGGYWVDTSGFTNQNAVSGRQLLPLWATGLGTDQEFPGGSNPNDGGTLYDTQLVCGLWCPNAAGDKIVSCSFDVAG